jgi:mannose-6-phosphate isomerase-like protein (cupin superfamily)
MTEANEVMAAWRPYLDAIDDWQKLVEGLEPKPTGCGPVYELGQPLPVRAHEEFAIADMRNVLVAEPHYHSNGEIEIYIVLSGLGKVVVGGKEIEVKVGSVVVTPPDTTHYTVPKENLVLAVINSPSFNPANYVPIIETDASVGFDKDQFAGDVEGAYRRKGLVTEHGADEAGKRYELHQHERTHLYTLAGSIVITLGEQSPKTVEPHQEVVVGNNQLHEATVGSDGWEFVAAWDEEEAKQYFH